jgi:tRNA(Ile)-lysidine synthase
VFGCTIVFVHPLARTLLEHIRQHGLIQPGDRVGVAVSGGSDSVALLRLLLELRSELGIVLHVLHLNHKLRGAESDADAEFVADLARNFKLEFHSAEHDTAAYAAEHQLSLETAARQLRYDFFSEAMEAASLDKVVTGHTLDDQAETVLMRIIRGTGMRGLRAIQPHLEIETEHGFGEIVRPLLQIRRAGLEQYLRDIGQPWRDDSTNRETKYTRNRVRHTLVPLLEREFNAEIAKGLSELAEIARAEEDYWENEVEGWMGTVVQWIPPKHARRTVDVPLTQLLPVGHEPEPPKSASEPMSALLDLGWLETQPLAVQRRVIRAIGEYAAIPLEFKHVEEILRFAGEEDGTGKQLALPRGWKLIHEGGTLDFQPPHQQVESEPKDYEYPLPVPGETRVSDTGIVVQALRVPVSDAAGYNPDHLFDPASLDKRLVVRNWHAGDRFWPAHTKSPRKLKELLQERHVPQPERKLWPVVVSGDEIIWVRGFPGRAQLRPKDGKEAVLIRELPVEEESDLLE